MSEVYRRLLSSFTFFFISVFCNFAIQYNSFEFNKLQWAVLLSGGIVLWIFPFVIEPLPNKMIAITVSDHPSKLDHHLIYKSRYFLYTTSFWIWCT